MWDVYVLATMVVVVSLVDTGPPRTSSVGSESEWPRECQGSRSVLSERRWSTRMGVRGHGLCGVGTVCSAECVLNLSIATLADMGPVHSWSHHGLTYNKSCALSIELCTVDDRGKVI